MLSFVRKRLPEPLKRALRRSRLELLSLGLPRRMDFAQPEAEAEASRSMSIIVAINDAPWMVERCLASLDRYAAQAEVILVDDGSMLGETANVIRHFRERNGWKLVRHESPLGHTQSCRSGASQATRPILCLLNSDTVVTPWSWKGILNAFQSDPNIAVAGPSTSWAFTIQQQMRAMYCRHFWTDGQIAAYARRATASGRKRPLVDLEKASGCAFFIRKDVWEQMGGFDPNLPDFANESELCMRLRARRYRIVWAQASYIHHFGLQSYGRFGREAIEAKRQAAWRYIKQKHNLS
jgi:GT2 family glycosyltransferase